MVLDCVDLCGHRRLGYVDDPKFAAGRCACRPALCGRAPTPPVTASRFDGRDASRAKLIAQEHSRSALQTLDVEDSVVVLTPFGGPPRALKTLMA